MFIVVSKLPVEMGEEFLHYCERHNTNRSAVIRRLIAEELEKDANDRLLEHQERRASGE
jgi:metal-responsive CopG/Arc/MetJ family transcriptional regulator